MSKRRNSVRLKKHGDLCYCQNCFHIGMSQCSKQKCKCCIVFVINERINEDGRSHYCKNQKHRKYDEL